MPASPVVTSSNAFFVAFLRHLRATKRPSRLSMVMTSNARGMILSELMLTLVLSNTYLSISLA